MKGPHSSAARLLGLTILLLYGAGAGMRASDRTFPSLEELDRIVSSTSEYDAAKQGIIDGCRHRLETAAEEQKPGLCNEMFYLYYAFQSDSALFYAHRAIDFSRAQGNVHEECTAKLNLAKIYQNAAICNIGPHHTKLQAHTSNPSPFWTASAEACSTPDRKRKCSRSTTRTTSP